MAPLLRPPLRPRPATTHPAGPGPGAAAQLSCPSRAESPADEFGWTISFSFPAGQRGYAWNWTACTTTREATDGIGLPAADGCGSKHILASVPGTLASPCARYLACAAPAPGVKPAPPPAQAQPTAPPPTNPPPTTPPPPPTPSPTSSPTVVVTVHSPGDQTSTAGVPIPGLQITGTDSAGLALSYSDGGTLPSGLAIDPSSGWISGTPMTPGIYQVMITATDSSGHTGHTTFTWTVVDKVTCNSPGDQVNTVGDAVSLPIICTDSAGEALTYSDGGTLPPGLAIDPSSGGIPGAVTTPGIYSVTITATDTSGITGSCSFTWTVNGSTPTP